ncbi:MAG: sorbosone dehydrogenase family protein [Allomuricauda sp.]
MDSKRLGYILYTLGLILFNCGCDNRNKESNKEVSIPTCTLETVKKKTLPLENLHLPKGFNIEVLVELTDARSIRISDSGTVFVSTRYADTVYALRDTDGDGCYDQKTLLNYPFNMPHGIALSENTLFVVEPDRVLKFEHIENVLEQPLQPKVIFDDFPPLGLHAWRYAKIGGDGKLYIAVGANCDLCPSDHIIQATIIRMDPMGNSMEIVASGVRNTVGFDWHPKTNRLWFTENGPNNLGEEFPPDELNEVMTLGGHYGFPFVFGVPKGKSSPVNTILPRVLLDPHSAPLGMVFHTGEQFPNEFKNSIFIARHGSSRQKGIGYDIVQVDVSDADHITTKVFASGWSSKQDDHTWGRPVDIAVAPDGSLLVSDDLAHVVYRIRYETKSQ